MPPLHAFTLGSPYSGHLNMCCRVYEPRDYKLKVNVIKVRKKKEHKNSKKGKSVIVLQSVYDLTVVPYSFSNIILIISHI